MVMGRTRSWGIAAAVVVAATTSVPGAPGRAAQPEDRPPNVLIVITDDQRPSGTLGVMPGTRRWFVQGGTHFVNALATTPTCCPSRASVMTGLYAHNHGVHTSAVSYTHQTLPTIA